MALRRTKIRVPVSLGIAGAEYETLWKDIENAIDCIYEKHVSNISFEQIYREVYTAVIKGWSKDLYRDLEQCLQNKMNKIYTNQFKDVPKGIELLNKISTIWSFQKHSLKLVSDLMLYLDSEDNRQKVYDLGISLYGECILQPCLSLVNASLVDEINYSRNNKSIPNAELLKDIVTMLSNVQSSVAGLSYFHAAFEPYLLSATKEYYCNSIEIEKLSLEEYVNRVVSLKRNEQKLNSQFLNDSTGDTIIDLLEDILVKDKALVKIPDFVRQAIDDGNAQLLRRLYDLSLSDEYRSKIQISIKDSVFQDLKEIKPNSEVKRKNQQALHWILQLLQIYNKYQTFLNQLKLIDTGLLDKKEEIQANLTTSLINEPLAKYLNLNSKKSVESIVLYIDTNLKLTENSTTTNQAREDLQKIVKLLKILSEKDLFEVLYKQNLSKRLLQKRSKLETERWMVQRIKDEMGTFFTSKMEGMLRDINGSSDLLQAFKASNEEPDTFDFIPQILTKTTWPFQGNHTLDQEVKLPSKLEQAKLSFEVFYTKKYRQRQLKWAYNLSLIEIGVQFEQAYHNLKMPFMAGIIFLLFQDNKTLSFSEISKLAGITENEVQRYLISMTVPPKTKVLKKLSPTKGINPSDIFTVNLQFTAPTKVVKIQTVSIQPPAKSDKHQTKDMMESILDNERLLQVNAAVVRTMKKHKTYRYDSLFESVKQALHSTFPVSNRLLNKSLEDLTEKEYVHRDPDDTALYHYIS